MNSLESEEIELPVFEGDNSVENVIKNKSFYPKKWTKEQVEQFFVLNGLKGIGLGLKIEGYDGEKLMGSSRSTLVLKFQVYNALKIMQLVTKLRKLAELQELRDGIVNDHELPNLSKIPKRKKNEADDESPTKRVRKGTSFFRENGGKGLQSDSEQNFRNQDGTLCETPSSTSSSHVLNDDEDDWGSTPSVVPQPQTNESKTIKSNDEDNWEQATSSSVTVDSSYGKISKSTDWADSSVSSRSSTLTLESSHKNDEEDWGDDNSSKASIPTFQVTTSNGNTKPLIEDDDDWGQAVESTPKPSRNRQLSSQSDGGRGFDNWGETPRRTNSFNSGSRNGPRPHRNDSFNGGTKSCYNCKEEGHMAYDCPKPRNSPFNSGRSSSGPRACFNCNEEGHMSRDCPKPRASRGGPRGGGGRGGVRAPCPNCNFEHFCSGAATNNSGDFTRGSSRSRNNSFRGTRGYSPRNRTNYASSSNTDDWASGRDSGGNRYSFHSEKNFASSNYSHTPSVSQDEEDWGSTETGNGSNSSFQRNGRNSSTNFNDNDWSNNGSTNKKSKFGNQLVPPSYENHPQTASNNSATSTSNNDEEWW